MPRCRRLSGLPGAGTSGGRPPQAGWAEPATDRVLPSRSHRPRSPARLPPSSRPRYGTVRTHCPWRRRDRPPPSAAVTAAPLCRRPAHSRDTGRKAPIHPPYRSGIAPADYPPSLRKTAGPKAAGKKPHRPCLTASSSEVRGTGSAAGKNGRYRTDQALGGQPRSQHPLRAVRGLFPPRGRHSTA